RPRLARCVGVVALNDHQRGDPSVATFLQGNGVVATILIKEGPNSRVSYGGLTKEGKYRRCDGGNGGSTNSARGPCGCHCARRHRGGLRNHRVTSPSLRLG